MNMEFVCDIYNNNFEAYIKQLLLFNDDLTLVYPKLHHHYSSDNEFVSNRIEYVRDLQSYTGLETKEYDGDYDNLIDYDNCMPYCHMIFDYLRLTEYERKCIINCLNSYWQRDLFFDKYEFNKYCGYIHSCCSVIISSANLYNMLISNQYNGINNCSSNSDILTNAIFRRVAPSFHKFPFNSLPNRISFIDNCTNCRNVPPAKQRSEVNSIEEIMTVLLPDYSRLSIDEILELKYYASDEVTALSFYINMIGSKNNDIQKVKLQIQKQIDDLEFKVKGLKATAIQKVLSLRNITYVPLIVALFPEIPNYIPLAISGGLISAEIAVSILQEKINIKRNPLYFTLTLNEIIDGI